MQRANAAGGGAKGQGRDPDKALAEDQGSTPEGRGEGQSPRVVAGGARPYLFFNSATYTKRWGGGGADPQAASSQNASKPVERPLCQPLSPTVAALFSMFQDVLRLP